MSSHPTPLIADSSAAVHHDENQLMIERREKLGALRRQQAEGKGAAFPNDIKPEHRAEALFAQYSHLSNEELAPMAIKVAVAGRMMLKRVMGKASFATLQDSSFGPSGGRIQLYINNAGVGEDVHAAFKHWDLGDIIAASGTLFRTKTGELSVHADSVKLVTKSLRPLPDKLPDLASKSTKPDEGVVSESMARILARQGKTARAVAMYEQLQARLPEKAAIFAAQIAALRGPAA